MKNRSKVIALVVTFSLTLIIAISSAVIVLVASAQNATSTVKAEYTSSDVWVRIEANYYVDGTTTALKYGSDTSVDLSPINTLGSLNQVDSVVNLSTENPKIIFEYIFTNLSDTIPAVISQTLNEDDSVMVPTDTYNNVTLKYITSSTQLGANASATSETLNPQALNPSATEYIYVVVEVSDLLVNVHFNGSFGWTLTRGTAVTTSTTNSSGNKIINVNTSETGLTNATELNSILLVLNTENDEPTIYPLVLNKAFTGWYYDSAYSNKVEWPIMVTDSTTLYPKTETATSGLTYSYSSGSYSVSGYSGSDTNVIIPDIYNDGTNGQASVTKIADNAFKNKTAITNVTIPQSITSIGYSAFLYCSGLTSITIPNSVTSIGNMAFSNCSGLTSIKVDSGNTKYDSRNNCNALIETSTNTLIAGCKNTVIPTSVTSIGRGAFYGCSKLTSITIPNSVTSIEDYVFYGCSKLTSITIPNSVTSIGETVFYNCSKLTSITIPNSVTSISSLAFFACDSLTNITIPSSVTSIGDYAFKNCRRLTNITIPSSVIIIGTQAFSVCSGLTNIVVDSSNSNYTSRDDSGIECNAIIETSTNKLIAGCKNTTIPNNVTEISQYAFNYCSGLTSITIPNSVTSIGDYAFNYCSSLTSLTIPNGVTSVGKNAFSNCTNLTNVTFENTTGWWVADSSSATSGDSVTISTTDLSANATLLKTTHVSKYWKRS